MGETVAKMTATKAAGEKGRRVRRPKDAQGMESQASSCAHNYTEAQAANTNVRVQSKIDEVTRRMIDVEQQLLAAQNADKDVTSLKEKLAKLQSERKANRERLIFRPMKKATARNDL